MVLNIGALVDHADYFDTRRYDDIEHHMPSLRETAITRLNIVARPSEQRAGGQIIEAGEQIVQVALGLIDAPLLRGIKPD